MRPNCAHEYAAEQSAERHQREAHRTRQRGDPAHEGLRDALEHDRPEHRVDEPRAEPGDHREPEHDPERHVEAQDEEPRRPADEEREQVDPEPRQTLAPGRGRHRADHRGAGEHREQQPDRPRATPGLLRPHRDEEAGVRQVQQVGHRHHDRDPEQDRVAAQEVPALAQLGEVRRRRLGWLHDRGRGDAGRLGPPGGLGPQPRRLGTARQGPGRPREDDRCQAEARGVDHERVGGPDPRDQAAGQGGAEHRGAPLDRGGEPGRAFHRHAGLLDEQRHQRVLGRVPGAAERAGDGDQAEEQGERQPAERVEQRDRAHHQHAGQVAADADPPRARPGR